MAGTFAVHALLPRQSGAGTHVGGGSNSASTLLSTLIPVFVVAAIVFTAFLYFRTRIARVYKPRTDERLLLQHYRTPQPTGFLATLKNFGSLPDEFVLQHNSLDGYLFLRFFKLLIFISLVGCVITWPILFPVNATGGGGQSQLDVLTFSNVVNANRYYAHAIVAWIFLGFVVLAVSRERVFFVGLRQAYFMSSLHAQRLSSRTILFQGIPEQKQSEDHLRTLLGPNIRKVWLVTDTEKLEEAVKEQDKAATKLEKSQVKLSKQANKLRLKEEKDGKSDAQRSERAGAEKWIDPKKRPTHRLKPIIGKKVDTIDWCQLELPKLSKDVQSQQSDHLNYKAKVVSAAFVEYDTQIAAHRAFQLVANKSRKEVNPRYVGVNPQEVIWKNLKMSWTSRKIKMALATTLVWLTIIFWTVPVAFVGVLSNINYLTDRVPFLSFINSIPPAILGVVTGLLPVVLLAVLIILVPIIMRLLAKLAGEPTQSAIELKTQSWYFGFQVIQVFLITTFSSGAASVATQILNNPTSAPALLAENLPKASNFYISYFILYGLNQAAMMLLSIGPLIVLTLVGKFLDTTPRKQFNRFMTLAGPGWGSEYPKWTNLGVIALSYSCIAPLVLGFSTIGFSLLYLAFRYNWLFVFGNKIDMKGEAYARALKQLLTGVYLSAFCLIGLFAIKTAGTPAAAGPLVLMIIFFIVVLVFNILFNRAIGPLEQHLPLDLLEKNEHSMQVSTEAYGKDGKDGYEMKENPSETSPRPDFHRASSDRTQAREEDSDTTAMTAGHPAYSADAKKESFFTRRIRIFSNKFYEDGKHTVSASGPISAMSNPSYTAEEYEEAYLNPAISSPKPFIWLAKDDCGVSKMMVESNKAANIESSDDFARFDEKNKLVWDQAKPEQVPIWRRRVIY